MAGHVKHVKCPYCEKETTAEGPSGRDVKYVRKLDHGGQGVFSEPTCQECARTFVVFYTGQ